MSSKMTDREKLIGLIYNSKCVETWDYYNDEPIKPCPIERLADYLLANNVSIKIISEWEHIDNPNTDIYERRPISVCKNCGAKRLGDTAYCCICGAEMKNKED